MKISDGEKLILVMLSELYERLGIKDEIDPKFVQAAIFSGNVWGLKWKYPGLFDIDETESAVVTEVVDILNMWTFIERAYERLSPEDKEQVKTEAQPFGTDVQFPGFDGNNETDHLVLQRDFVTSHPIVRGCACDGTDTPRGYAAG